MQCDAYEGTRLYPEVPEAFITILEYRFEEARVSQRSKYNKWLSPITNNMIKQIRDIIVHLPTANSYDVLRDELIKPLTVSGPRSASTENAVISGSDLCERHRSPSAMAGAFAIIHARHFSGVHTPTELRIVY